LLVHLARYVKVESCLCFKRRGRTPHADRTASVCASAARCFAAPTRRFRFWKKITKLDPTFASDGSMVRYKAWVGYVEVYENGTIVPGGYTTEVRQSLNCIVTPAPVNTPAPVDGPVTGVA
jgi:hypothetical protein